MTPVPTLRLVFMGTAGFAVPSLLALAGGRHSVVAVYTQPARPAGRGLALRPSPVQRAALAHDLEIRTPAALRDPASQDGLRALAPDLAVVAAYGLILPQAVLAIPRLGCINLHGSLLPRWRGAAPIQRAILAGDDATGITVIQMDTGLDTGPVLTMAPVPIGAQTTAGELHDALAALAAEMIGKVVEEVAAGRATARPQPADGVTYAAKIDKAETRLDWARPAAALARQLRAFDPWPGCWTTAGGQRVRVLAGVVHDPSAAGGASARVSGKEPGEVLDEALTVACGEGALRLTRVQRAGGKPMTATEFLRGAPVPVGSRLGEPCPATS